MPMYLFSYDQRSNSFPECYRVVSSDDDAEFLCKKENLTGTVAHLEAMELLEELMARYQSDDSITVEFVDAPHWRFVELRYNPAEAEAAERRPGTP